MQLAPEIADYVAEFGYQQGMLGEYNNAIQTYRMATHLDELNTRSIYGTIFCQLQDGQVKRIDLSTLTSTTSA